MVVLGLLRPFRERLLSADSVEKVDHGFRS
jgi:hypothetical protein